MINKFFTKIFKSNVNLALFAAILGASIVNLSPIFVRLSEVGPTTTAFYRFFFALPLLWGWMVFDGATNSLSRVPRGFKEFSLLIAAGIFLALDITFWYMAMLHTTIVNAVLLNNFCTVLVAIGAWYFFKDPMSWKLILAIFLAMLGSGLLVGTKIELGLETLRGDIYGLISAVFFAGFLLIVKHLRSHFSTPTIMMWGGFSSLYVLAFVAYFMGETLIPQTTHGWMILIVLGVAVHVCGQGLMNYAMAHIPVTFSSITTFIGPVIAALLGFFYFKEELSLPQFAGMVIILAGIVLSRHAQQKPKPHAP